MDAYITGAFPLKIKHTTQPNTDQAAIAAFESAFQMHDCKPYNATIRAEACMKRRALALKTPRTAYKHSIRGTWKTDAVMGVDKCLDCQSYATKPVPVKYGTCACGKEGRLVARGKCSGCYQRYRKGL